MERLGAAQLLDVEVPQPISLIALSNPNNFEQFILEIQGNGQDARQIVEYFSQPAQEGVLREHPALADAVNGAKALYLNAPAQREEAPVVVAVEPSAHPNTYFADSITFRSQVEQLFVIGEMCLPVIGALPRVMFAVAKLVVDLTTVIFHSTLSGLSKAFAYCGFVNVAAKLDGGKVEDEADKKMHEVYAEARFELLTHDAANLVRGIMTMIPVFGQALAIVLHKSDVRFAYTLEETAPSTTRLFDADDSARRLDEAKQQALVRSLENQIKIAESQAMLARLAPEGGDDE